MNFYALTCKYFPDAQVTVHDRTYEGLEWHGPGEKPALEVFESFQEEEDRLARAAGREVLSRESVMQERQRQARAQAELDLVPFQQKLGEYFEAERLRFLKASQDALELKALLGLKEHGMSAWKEISEAQDAINQRAQKYLEETAHYLAWDPHKIPVEVLEQREKMHALIDEGKTVYADWASLRAKEMPSRQDIAEAIRKGGDHLRRMQAACKEVAVRYPRPKKTH